MDRFTFTNIAGQPASLEINDRGDHMFVTWGTLTISDVSGEIGFWETFRQKPAYWSKGAARTAALRKHAREFIEHEIYSQMQFAQQEEPPQVTNRDVLSALEMALGTIKWMNECSDPAQDEVDKAICEIQLAIDERT